MSQGGLPSFRQIAAANAASYRMRRAKSLAAGDWRVDNARL
jgi:hypothetical protein